MGNRQHQYRHPKLTKKGEQNRRKTIGGPRGWSPTEEAVELVAHAMAQRAMKRTWSAIIYQCAGEDLGTTNAQGLPFFHVGVETINKVIHSARQLLKDRLKVDRNEEIGKAIGVYEDVIRDPQATKTEKIKAQERIDFILGHDAKFSASRDNLEETAAKLRDVLKGIDFLTGGEKAAAERK